MNYADKKQSQSEAIENIKRYLSLTQIDFIRYFIHYNS